MALIRWNPWSIDRFLEEDWDLPTLPGVSRLVGQGLNLYETDDSIVAEAAIPGVPEDRIDVTVEKDGTVRITGSAEDAKEDRSKRRYFMSSMTTSFNYVFRLPQGIISEKEPDVEFDNGILRLIFPKQAKEAPKKIKVSKRREMKEGGTSHKSL